MSVRWTNTPFARRPEPPLSPYPFPTTRQDYWVIWSVVAVIVSGLVFWVLAGWAAVP